MNAKLGSRLIALVLVALLGGVAFHFMDQSMLSEMNSMSADEYLKKAKELHTNSYLFSVMVTFFFVGMFWGMVEGIAYFLRRFVRKNSK